MFRMTFLYFSEPVEKTTWSGIIARTTTPDSPKTQTHDMMGDEKEDLAEGISGSSIYIIVICSLNLLLLFLFKTKKIKNMLVDKCKKKRKHVKRKKKFSSWLFRKNQIVKENKLPSKYELQEIIRPCTKSNDEFDDDDFYDEVNFDARLYANKK